MKNLKTMLSSNDMTWAIPKIFFDELNKEFNFNLDPCATKETAKCKKYFTKEMDGLKQNWDGHRVFCNPPYGREIGKWVKKSYDEWVKKTSTIVMLIPARTDTRYFHDYILGKAEIRFIRGRLKFIDMDYKGKEEDRKLSPAPFPSMLIIYR